MNKPRILVLEGLSGAAQCVRAAGGYAVTAYPRSLGEVSTLVESGQIDGLLLTGGGDVNPRLYNRKPHRKVYGVSEARDKVEIYALLMAAKHDWPVLGICRGSQLINVHAGGNLIQHIGGHYGEHMVLTMPGTTLHNVVGPDMMVTSLHHQAVRKVAPGYSVAARALDGTIEAVASDDGRVLGVQYHPEMDRRNPQARAIFRWLVSESAARRTRGAPVGDWDWSYDDLTYALTNDAWVTADSAPKKTSRKRPNGRRPGPVTKRWFCSQCDISTFDNWEDYTGHMDMLHPTSTLTTPRVRAARDALTAERKTARETLPALYADDYEII